MSWAIGFDSRWQRWIGYGVPAYCDQPQCKEQIDRGLGYVCGGEPYGGEHGCGLFFCPAHLSLGPHGQVCPRCYAYKSWYKRIKPEHPVWIKHMLTDRSWAKWRKENPEAVQRMKDSPERSEG